MLFKKYQFLMPLELRGYILLGIVVLLIGGCMGQTQKQPEQIRRPADAQDVLFFQGEDLFNAGEFEPALSVFTQYMGQYPQGRHASAASYYIGSIYQAQGDIEAARAFYLGVIENFPQSPDVFRASMAMIDLYIKENQPAAALELAGGMLDAQLDAEQRLTLLERLFHLSMMVQDSAHTTLYAYMLFQLSAEPDKEHWDQLLIESIGNLDGPAIEALWDRLVDQRVRSYLMYRYAVVQVMTENYDDAMDLLTAFRHTYPGHPFDQDALNLIQMLTQRLLFKPYTVGCLVPLTGSYKTYGQRVLNAVEMALMGIQAGETPLPIKLVVKDTASDEQRAVQAVRELVQKGAGIIIGPIITSHAAALEAQKLNVPIVTFTQKGDITATGDFVFRHFITPHSQVKTLVEFFINDLGLRSFAVLYPREAYGNTFMNLFWDELIRQGGEMVGVEAYEPKQTDFADTIKKLTGLYYSVPNDLQLEPVVQVEENPYYRSAPANIESLEDVLPDPVTRLTGLFFQDPDQDRIKGPAIGRRRQEEIQQPIVDFDVLFIPDAPKAIGLILPQLAYHDVKNIYTAGTNLWHSQQLIDMTKQYAQNAVMVDGFYKDSQSETVRSFVTRYQSIFGEDPGLMEAFAFDTANFVFELISQPGIQLRNELRNAMKQTYIADGVTGATAFGPNGDAIKRLSLLRVKGNHFIEITTP